MGFLDDRLAFMRFTAQSAGGLWDPAALKSPVEQAWTEQLRAFNARAHPGVSRAKQTAGLDWSFIVTERQLGVTMQ